MKICFLNHDLKPGTGAGRFGLNLIGRVEAIPGMSVRVLTTSGSGDPRETAILFKGRIGLFLALPRIRRIFRDADIIHALDGYPYGVIASLALVGLRRKLVITAIGTGAIQRLYRWDGFLLRGAYRRADRIVAISRYTRREILKRVPDLEIAVVNHAIDAQEFAPGGEEISPEERSKIASLRPYIISVGGWKRRKGFEESFAAYAEIRKRFPDLKYVICGIGPKLQLEEPLGLAGSVFYFKGVSWPFLKALYRNAELFMLLPIDDNHDVEGFGFAFLEAAASGLPVIGTSQSGSEDAISEGRNGVLVRPGDVEGAARAACSVLENADLRRRFREGSLAFAREMNWDRVIRAYQDIYGALML